MAPSQYASWQGAQASYDMTSILQAYFTACKNGNFRAFLPSGNYAISSSLAIPLALDICGAGVNSTSISTIGNSVSFPIFINTLNGSLGFSTISNIQLNHGSWGIFCNITGANTNFMFQCNFTNVYFNNQGTGAIYCNSNMLDCIFVNVFFNSCANGVYSGGQSQTVGGGANNNVFIECHWSGINGYDVAFLGYNGVRSFTVGIGGQNNQFIGCFFQGVTVSTTASFNGTVSGSVLTLTSTAVGNFQLGLPLFLSVPSPSFAIGGFIQSLASGSLGQSGSTYNLTTGNIGNSGVAPVAFSPGNIGAPTSMLAGGVDIILQSTSNTVFQGNYFENIYPQILSEQYGIGTTEFHQNWFTGEIPGSTGEESFFSDAIVTFDANTFAVEYGSLGAAQMMLKGNNGGLYTQNSSVWECLTDSHIRVSTRTYSTSNSTFTSPQNIFNFTNISGGGGGANDTEVLSGTITGSFASSNGSSVQGYLTYIWPIQIRQFSATNMVISIGTSLSVTTDNAGALTASIAQATSPAASNTSVMLQTTVSGDTILDCRFCLDLVSTRHSTRQAISVIPQ
jgi:hypothetical protein